MATPADFARIGNYARIYNKDQGIDRRQSKRVVPMEVLCLGMSRTGTLSMRRATELLGYPNPYHFSSQLDNVRDFDAWLEAMRAKYDGVGTPPDKAFFDGMLGHCGAVTDMPCILFAAELVKFYPDAKVVLVERDLESWYASWMAFCEGSYSRALYLSSRLDPGWAKRVADMGCRGTEIVAGHAQTIDEARVRSKDAYRHYYRDIKEMVPKERLLEFNLKDGWEPLCKFLGKPVPVSVGVRCLDSADACFRTSLFPMRMIQRQINSFSWSLLRLPKGIF